MQHTAPRLLLRIPEAAEALGIGRSTLYELLAKGEIQSIKIGRSVRVPVTSLEEWVSGQPSYSVSSEEGATNDLEAA